MAECELLRTCIFFTNQMSEMPSTAEAIKRRYCLNDNAECARYMIFKALGRRKVPATLLPGQTAKALAVIANP